MTKQELTGLVILMDNQKELIQTKRIRVYQRESLVDHLHFLVPLVYESNDLTQFTVTMQYLDQSGTVHSDALTRLPDGQGGYDDYCDADGNPTHMVMCLPIDSKLTMFAGDITIKLTMDYIDYPAQTSSASDDEPAPEPTPVHYVLNTGSTILPVLPVSDYYSIIPDESLSVINEKIVELDQKQKELEATAEIYDAAKADNIKLDADEGTLYLTSHDQQVGDKIDLEDLGNATADDTADGLVTVVL